MSALDRVTAAIGDDSPVSAASQAELVADMLARKITQRTCQACLIDFDPSGYCNCCGATQRVVTPETT